jgi:hypothetical protein
VTAPQPSSGGAMQSALLSGSRSADLGSTGSIAKLNFNTSAGGDDGVGSRRATSVGIQLPADAGPEIELKRTSSGGGTLGLAVKVKAEREKPLIKDPEEIKQHIYNVLVKSLPTLTDCYRERLKEDRTVRGKWRISFVVTRGGRAKDPGAQGISMVDAKLESCMKKKILTWSFYRLPTDQPVSKSLTFSPG